MSPILTSTLRTIITAALADLAEHAGADDVALYVPSRAGGFHRFGVYGSHAAARLPRRLTGGDSRANGLIERLAEWGAHLIAPIRGPGGTPAFVLFTRETGRLPTTGEIDPALRLFSTVLEQAITQRAATAHAVRQTRLLNAVLNSTRGAIFVVEPDRRLSLAGRPVQTILGLAQDEVTLEGIFERLPPADQRRALRAYFRARRRRAAEQVEVRMVADTGFHRTLRVTFSPLQGAGGSGRIVGLADDITEVKKLGLQLIQASKLATLGELSAGVAHEINQPLHAIRISTGLMQEHLAERAGLDDFLSERFQRIDAMIERSQRIVEHLRRFGRTADLEMKSCNAAAPLRDALDLLDAKLQRVNIPVVFDAEDSALQVQCDPVALEQVFVNLLVNAMDAIEEARLEPAPANRADAIRIEITRTPDQRFIAYAITDTGAGLQPLLAEAVFLPFFTTKPAGKGLGLGLSISYSIVSGHGGTIHVASEPGRTTFTVLIPRERSRES